MNSLKEAVTEVEKSFPGVRALVKVSFECRAGEIHGLVGENGAGKSTLMRILAGVHRPDSGSIQISGKGVILNSPRHAHDLGIAMVYQSARYWLGCERRERGLSLSRIAFRRCWTSLTELRS